MKQKTRITILEYLGIIFGCFVVALGFVIFINPYKLVPGGVFGTSIILHHIFPSIQVGTFGYMLEVPLLLASALCLGKSVGVRTLVASFASPFFMNLLSSLFYPTKEALQSLDPAQLLNGMIDLSNDKIIAVILGPLLIGLGEGLMIKCKASSGGSDVVAMIISKYMRVKVSKAVLCVDGCVVLVGMIVIGFGIGSDSPSDGSLVLTGYSLLCIYILSKILSLAMTGLKNDKIMFIVTSKESERLHHFILHDLDRTATCFTSHGMYSGEDKATLMMVVHQREVDYITTRIKNFCPDVFIAVTDAYDAYGERWDELPSENDLVMR